MENSKYSSNQKPVAKGVIAWFVKNPVAANILMFAIIGFGLYGASKKTPLEVFPAFEADVVNIAVAYAGATPNEVEQGITIRVEDAIADLPGVDRVYSTSHEGRSLVRAEIRPRYDATVVLNEIKSRIDRVTALPDDAERPVVDLLVRLRDVITVVIEQDRKDDVVLRQNTEKIRDEIRALSGVTQVAMGGVRPWEISITVPELTLRQYGLTLADISNVIRSASRDIPGGTIKTKSGDILVRALGQAYHKNDFANISILSRKNGTRIRLGDIATINDGFNNEDTLYSQFDKKHAAFINVSRVGDQNAIVLANTVKEYIDERKHTLPAGLSLNYWQDSSKIVKARLSTLTYSFIQGIILVLILLALFLRPDLAFWVSIGVPISFLGALAVMPQLDVTLNLVSMFGFILVLGIVVDDAIVTGENVYSHLQRHGDGMRAAIEGTKEISIPVTFGVLTTVAAFSPLLMIDGFRGKIFAQIPLVVIPVLLFSLIESKFVLPSHIQHMKLRGKDKKPNILIRIQQFISRGLEFFIDRIFNPFLNMALNWRYLTLVIFISILILTVAMVISGRFKYTFFPKIPSEVITATLEMPEGTAINITEKYIARITKMAEQLQGKYYEADRRKLIQHILVTVGTGGGRPRANTVGKSHLGSVTFEILPPESRSSTVKSGELVTEWRKMIGPIPGVQNLSFFAELGRGGDPINVQLKGQNFKELNQLAMQVKEKLAKYEGLHDIKNSFEGGKDEVQLRIRPEAEQLGLNLSQLGTQVRHAIYGAEAQRIQRDQSEVRVMVRTPKSERHSLSDLQNLRIHLPNGKDVPLSEVAIINLGKGSSSISRVDRQRIINITADLNKEKINANKVVADLKEWMPSILKDHPGVIFDMEGEQLEQKKFRKSLMFGFLIALLSIYILLAIPFGSYLQPLMVMSVIPFSIIGAIAGHAIEDKSLSISSAMGVLALIGVVVNDSLVLVDYTNKRIKEGVPVEKAIRIAGGARFRPILLTSLTTFAGLTPLILDKSTQAQFLIPMAISLGYGILFATMLTLVLIPTFYLIVEDIKSISRKLWAVLT